MGLIGYLDILSSVDTSGLKKGLGSAGGMISTFAGQIGGLGSIGTVLGGAGLAAGFLEASGAAVHLAVDTSRTAAKLGVTTKALSELRYAAKYTGVDTESLDMALMKFSVNLGKVDEEGGATAAALHSIGLNAEKLAAMKPDQALLQIAGAFDRLPDQASKASTAVAIFGRGGVQILPFLSAGKKGIAELVKEGDALGITFGDLEARRLVELEHSFEKVQDTTVGLARELTVELAPAFISVAGAILQMVKATKSAIVLAGDKGLVNPAGMSGALLKLAAPKADNTPASTPAEDAAKRKAQAQAELGLKVQDLDKDLRKQVATFGMSAEQIKVWELAQQGASAKVLQTATALATQKLRLEENKKHIEELTQAGKSMLEGALTPLEKANQSLMIAIELRKRQIMSEAEFQRAIKKTGEDFAKAGMEAVGANLTPLEKFMKRRAELLGHLNDKTINKEGFDRGLKDAMEDFKKSGKDLVGASLTPLEQYIKRRKELLKGVEEGTIDRKQFSRGLDEAKKGFAESVKGLTGDLETPKEKYLAKMAELQKAVREGSIDKQTFSRAHAASFKEFQGATGADEPKFAGALQAGSQEARSQILKFTHGDNRDPFQELTKNGREQLQVAQAGVAVLKSLDNKLGKSTDMPEADF